MIELRPPIISNLNVNLEGRVAIVTGSSKGIGRAIALSLAMSGADVVINGRKKEDLMKTAEEIKALNRRVLPVVADVSKWDDVKRMVDETIKHFGHIEIVVNNAGILGPVKPVHEITVEEWDKVLAINLGGAFLVIKAVVPYMIKQKYGKIINISSVAGVEGNKNMVPYCASKAALIGLTKALAEELGPYGIRINAVCPALVEKTYLTESMPPEQREFLAKKIPLGRLCRLDEVADLVKFLASDASDFLTGYAFVLAGGRARCH